MVVGRWSLATDRFAHALTCSAFAALHVFPQDCIDRRLVAPALLTKEGQHVRIEPQCYLFLRPWPEYCSCEEIGGRVRASRKNPCPHPEGHQPASSLFWIAFWYCLSSRRVAFPGEMIRMVSGLGSVKIGYAVRPRIEPIPIQRFSPYSSRLSGSTTSTPRNISFAPTKSQPCSRMFARFLASSHSSHVVTPNVATGKEQHSDHPCAIRKTVWWASHNRGTFAP